MLTTFRLPLFVCALHLASVCAVLAQARLDGKVTDPAGDPVPDAQIAVTAAGAADAAASAQTTATGEFAFTALAPGSYTVRVTAASFAPAERRVTLSTRGAVHLGIPLALGFAESLNVVGGQPQDLGLALDVPSDTGSRLGLTPRELPSSLDLVTQPQMETRGHRTAQEAVQSAIGVSVGDHPSDTGFTTRGFAQDGVPVFYEGIKTPVANAFQIDAWNLERIEVLKGPASSLYGEGAVGGAVNFAYKRPDRGRHTAEGMFSAGSFGTTRLGVGAGGPLGTSGGHYRVDYSLQHADSFVARSERELHNLTSALAWDLGSRVDVQLSFDVQHNDIGASYWGTPLLPLASAADPIDGVVRTRDGRTIDRALSRNNYNVSDSTTKLTSYWTQGRVQWRPAPGIALRNDFYRTTSDREWKNAEAYGYDPATNLIERDRFFVSHGVSLTGDRLALSVKRPVGGFANSLLAGFDVSRMEFLRVPRYRGGVDFVDRDNTSPGVFGPLEPRSYTTQRVDTQAFFFEDYFSLRSDLRLSVSGRAERIDANHGSFDFAPGTAVTRDPSGGIPVPEDTFGRVFTPFTWKVGVIHDTRPGLSMYAHVATSANPADADLVFGVADFDLATGRQVEMGARQTLPRGAEWTAAYYWLERKNVLTQTGPESSAPVGRQSTRGVELSFGIRPVGAWNVRATAAFLEPRYDDFKESVDDLLVSRDGNRPPNVPRAVIDLQSSVRIGRRQPVEVGGAYHYIGDRFNGLDNSVTMLGYTVADAFASWTLSRYRITGRVRNLFDADYANWGSQFYTTQVSLGPPRTAEVDVSFRF